MIKIENVSKHFKGLKAVSNVSFDVEDGKITGLIGPNGAGKTTLFNVVCGFYEATEGRVFYKEKEITGLKPHQLSQLGIGRTFQIMKPLKNMSVLDNVIVGSLYGSKENSKKTYDEAVESSLEILNFTGLLDKKDFIAKELSTPNKKRLELARALATKPKVLLLDEVMAGLNPTETDECVELIKRINKTGITIFLIEHVMRAVVNLCEKIVVLHHGEKIAEGSPEKVMNDNTVIEIYLGKDEEYA